MRHQKQGKTLGRKASHRDAMWSNMVASLIEHERITTTDVKAKELRRFAERTITWASSLGDVLTKDPEKLDAEDRARKVHAMRMARRVLKQPEALAKLFDEVGPRFIGRPGGYTRVLKLGNRHGDAAPVSIVELVVRGEEEEAAKEASAGKAEKPAKREAAEAAPAKARKAAATESGEKKPAKKKADAPAKAKKPAKKGSEE